MFEHLFTPALHSAQLFPNGIDTHCHILPGVDDGAPDIDTSLAIIREQIRSGLSGACCTPHIALRYPNNTPTRLREHFNQLQQSVEQQLGPNTFRLHLAAEYMIDEGLETALQEQGAPLLLPSRRILVELPQYLMPDGWMDTLLHLKEQNYQPVLAHPERYLRHLSTEDIAAIAAQGIELQGNIGSLTGYYGQHIKQRARSLRDQGLYTHWGTDAHSPRMMHQLRLKP